MKDRNKPVAIIIGVSVFITILAILSAYTKYNVFGWIASLFGG